jgi:nucleoside-diphosphate-sugar epimerase
LRESDHGSGIDGGTYGYGKVLCEYESRIFPQRTIIRPTYVIGRTDPTSRFNRWIARICEGGDIALPYPSDLPFQAVDVRDVALFLAMVISETIVGTFQLTAPFPPISFMEALTAVSSFSPRGCRFIEISEGDMTASGLTDVEMPLWPGWNADHSEEAGDPIRAITAGFSPRPFKETISWLVSGFLEGTTTV